MSAPHKSQLSETDICDQYITPALQRAGWCIQQHILREYTLRPGRVVVRGQVAQRDKASILRADYVLFHKPNVPLAVVEAKDARHAVGAGMAQASVTRMATLADGGRISAGLVDAEIQRLQWLWQPAGAQQTRDVDLGTLLAADVVSQIDLFDRMQLESVVRVCRELPTLSEAGRRLFDKSRMQRSVVNDADRLRKYLLKFGLSWDEVRPSAIRD